MRRLFRFRRDLTGNLPPLPGIFPDGMAAVVRTGADGERELAMLRWGMPCPPAYGGRPSPTSATPRARTGGAGSVRRTAASCRSRASANTPTPSRARRRRGSPGTRAGRSLAFAGIWTTWRGTRGTKANPVEGEHQLFGFLTTEANAVVATMHPKAMPVILRNEAEFDGWLTTPADVALVLQRPLPDDELMIVATGEREDKAA